MYDIISFLRKFLIIKWQSANFVKCKQHLKYFWIITINLINLDNNLIKNKLKVDIKFKWNMSITFWNER